MSLSLRLSLVASFSVNLIISSALRSRICLLGVMIPTLISSLRHEWKILKTAAGVGRPMYCFTSAL